MVWDKPSSFDIDAFEKLGNPGWNWDAYHKFTNRTETFVSSYLFYLYHLMSQQRLQIPPPTGRTQGEIWIYIRGEAPRLVR